LLYVVPHFGLRPLRRLKEKKARVEDALHATHAAVEEGSIMTPNIIKYYRDI